MTAAAITTSEISDVTRTCQPAPRVSTAPLLGALEAAWTAIRTRHPEVPAAVVVVGSGSPTKTSQSMIWGHFATLRWQAGDDRLPEVLVSGEGLSRTPAEVFTTLLHEAAHGLADARGVKDTSRQGRWHNKQFATLAAELGMTTTKDDKLGYSPCTLTDDAADVYRPVIARLGKALRVYRHPEPLSAAKGRTNNNNGVSAECECPRRIRVSETVLDEGPVGCHLCRAWFLPNDVDRDAYTTDNPYPTGGHDQADTEHGENPEDDDMVFFDPTGARYGLPTYPYGLAPTGLATIRQLNAQGLRPGGQDIAAQVLWRRGKRKAYLYRVEDAKPKRTATPAQVAAIAKANTARRTCPTCGETKDYIIPTRWGECIDCHRTDSSGGA